MGRPTKIVVAVCAIAFYRSGVSAGLGAIVLPLIGFILLTRPDSRWYFMR
ncbi:hypothetical protein [Kibdelosporangium aridum]|nr:hypothetical protein [Kibdelosporangium aridum]